MEAVRTVCGILAFLAVFALAGVQVYRYDKAQPHHCLDTPMRDGCQHPDHRVAQLGGNVYCFCPKTLKRGIVQLDPEPVASAKPAGSR
jgi:hypothetical protein